VIEEREGVLLPLVPPELELLLPPHAASKSGMSKSSTRDIVLNKREKSAICPPNKMKDCTTNEVIRIGMLSRFLLCLRCRSD
jgi:hypothetical protein